MEREKLQLIIIFALIGIIVYLLVGFVLPNLKEPKLILVPTLKKTSQSSFSPTPDFDLISQFQLENLKRKFSSDSGLEEKTKEPIEELPSSLKPLADKLKETFNLGSFEKVSYKDGRVAYLISFTSDKYFVDIFNDLSKKIIPANEGWDRNTTKGGYNQFAGFLKSENKKLGFEFEIEIIKKENPSIKNGTIKLISIK